MACRVTLSEKKKEAQKPYRSKILSIGLPLVILYITAVFIIAACASINENRDGGRMLFYYLVSLLLCLFSIGVSYTAFRNGVQTLLEKKRKIAAWNVDRHKMGERNFWFYEKIQKAFHIGKLYYLNKIYLFFFLFVFFSTLIFGLMNEAAIVIFALITALYTLSLIVLATGLRYSIRRRGMGAYYMSPRGHLTPLVGVLISVFICVIFHLLLPYLHFRMLCSLDV